MSMILRTFAYLIAVFSIACAGIAAAHEYKAGNLEIVHPWSRATPTGAKVGAGYVVIKNNGSEPDRLVSATAEVAGRVEIHEMKVKDNIMTMRHLPEGLAIPAKGSVALEPAGFHLMFLDLKSPLKSGEPFSGSLKFKKAGTVEVKFVVEAIGAKESAHSGH